MTLFDHLNNIYFNKGDWNTLSESDRKTWNTFMVHKYISMLGEGECILVNEIQKYSKLDPKIVYTFYKEHFTPRKRFAKYIKGSKEPKHNAELVKILATHYQISHRETIEYLDILSKEVITGILTEYGYDAKEIKTLLK